MTDRPVRQLDPMLDRVEEMTIDREAGSDPALRRELDMTGRLESLRASLRLTEQAAAMPRPALRLAVAKLDPGDRNQYLAQVQFDRQAPIRRR